MANSITKTKPKRRWLQFSIRTVLVIVTLLCVALAVWVVPLERQRRAVAAIEALGGRFEYATNEAASESFPVAFLRRWLPQAYFDEVESVDFNGTEITDEGLAHLEGLTGLQTLLLNNTQITDADLVHLEGLTSLDWLTLENTPITDEGLVHLRGLANLRKLDLENTHVTDGGLARLQGLTSLKSLNLAKTRVTDAGMIHIREMTGLQGLYLGYTQFTNAGISHLQGLIGLRSLDLSNTQATDAGLIHLREMTSLKLLYLRRTRVTDAGAAQLREALPKCRIVGPLRRRQVDGRKAGEGKKHMKSSKKLLIVVYFLGAVAASVAIHRFTRKPNGAAENIDRRLNMNDLVLVSPSASQERLVKAGLASEGSENVQHLLSVPNLKAAAVIEEEIDYRPLDSIAWVLDLAFDGEPVHQQPQLAELFGPEWSRANGRPTVYGWSPETKHWTFLFSADGPKTFTKLCFGWDLVDPLDDEMQIDAESLERFKQAAIQAAESLGRPKATLNRTATEAVTLATCLNLLMREGQGDVVVVLKAPDGKPFAGLDIWDVMRCLGLEWGDGDLFHWINESEIGDDLFFSVETSTPPGYFKPKQIAAGTVEVGDLIFAYSIPRCAAPNEVFDSLLRAVEYARSRLGGAVVDRFGKPFDADTVRAEIKRIAERLRQEGMEPGSDAALRVF